MTPTEMLVPPQILDVLLSSAGAKAAILLRVEDQSIVAMGGDLHEADLARIVAALDYVGSPFDGNEWAHEQKIRIDDSLYALTAQGLARGQFILAVVFPLGKARSDIHQEMIFLSRVLQAFLQVNVKSAVSLERFDEGLDPTPAPTKNLEPQGSSTASDWVHLSGDYFEADQEQAPESAITERSSSDRILPEETWQILSELDQPDDDLVSIFQNDFDLHDVAMDQEPWLITPDPVVHEAVDPAVKSVPSFSPEPLDQGGEQVDGIEVSDGTFFLIPFGKDHHLVGDLTSLLREWFPAICRKYGWQLVSLSIRPGYLRWTLADFPDLLSHEMLRIVRRETSWRIHRLFPGLQSVEQPADFWAPGILMTTRNSDMSQQADLQPFLVSSSQADR